MYRMASATTLSRRARKTSCEMACGFSEATESDSVMGAGGGLEKGESAVRGKGDTQTELANNTRNLNLQQ